MENESQSWQYKTRSSSCLISEKNNVHYPPITFNNVSLKRVQTSQTLRINTGLKLNFHENISSILSKVNKLNPVLWKLQTVLSRHSLLTIYNAFIRTHLDYNDVICDKTFNESWHKKLESARGYSRH